MLSVVTVILSAVAAVLGFVLGPLCCRFLNKIPAAWLCDYDEEPSDELLSGTRFKVKPDGLIMGGVLAVAMATDVLLTGISYTLPLVLILFLLLMLISASDAKYTIIPDQFTAAVAVISVLFAIIDLFTEQTFIEKWYVPVLGAICGGGLLIILDLLSMLIFKRTGFGFGDVKLLAALGLFFGVKYVIVMLIISFFAAAVHFLILIFTGKARRGVYLPMGPYICIAAAITVALQPQISSLFHLYRTLMTMDVLP